MDIIHRLNALANHEHDDLSIGHEAAETIIALGMEVERLRTRILELENELAAGVHTCGPTCRKTRACAARADLREENERLCAQIDALQARVDALMLEFCPDEMTKSQLENWARHQRPASDEVQAAFADVSRAGTAST